MVHKRGFIQIPFIILGTLVVTTIILLTSKAAKQKFSLAPRASACYEQSTGYGTCNVTGCHQRNIAGDPDNGKWFKCSGEWKGPCGTQAECEGGSSTNPPPANPPAKPPTTGDWCCAGTCADTNAKNLFNAQYGADGKAHWLSEAEKNLNQTPGSCSNGTKVSPPPTGGENPNCGGGYDWDSAIAGCSGASKFDCACKKLVSGGTQCSSPGTPSGNNICVGNKWDCTWGCYVPKPQPTATPTPNASKDVYTVTVTVNASITNCPDKQITALGINESPETNKRYADTYVSKGSTTTTKSFTFTVPSNGKYSVPAYSWMNVNNISDGKGSTFWGDDRDPIAIDKATLKGSKTYAVLKDCSAGAPPKTSNGNWVRCDNGKASCNDFCISKGQTCVADNNGNGMREQEVGMASPAFGSCSETNAPYDRANNAKIAGVCGTAFNTFCNCSASAQPDNQPGALATIVTFTGSFTGTAAYSNRVALTGVTSDNTVFSNITSACNGVIETGKTNNGDGTFKLRYLINPTKACNVASLYAALSGQSLTFTLFSNETGNPAVNLTPNAITKPLSSSTVDLGTIALLLKTQPPAITTLTTTFQANLIGVEPYGTLYINNGIDSNTCVTYPSTQTITRSGVVQTAIQINYTGQCKTDLDHAYNRDDLPILPFIECGIFVYDTAEKASRHQSPIAQVGGFCHINETSEQAPLPLPPKSGSTEKIKSTHVRVILKSLSNCSHDTETKIVTTLGTNLGDGNIPLSCQNEISYPSTFPKTTVECDIDISPLNGFFSVAPNFYLGQGMGYLQMKQIPATQYSLTDPANKNIDISVDQSCP